MVNILQSLDIFGYRFNFLYKGEIAYKTSFGGLISLISIFTFFFSFFYFGQDFIYRLNPRIFLKQKLADNSYISKIKDLDLVLGFSIDDLDPDDILNNKYFITRAFYSKKSLFNSNDD